MQFSNDNRSKPEALAIGGYPWRPDMLTIANDNLREVAAGSSYYPEMGQRAPACAIVKAQLAHYGRHYYLTFPTAQTDTVMGTVRAAKVRFSDLDTSESVRGELRTTIRVTCAAYDRLRAANRAMFTSEILLD